MTIINSGSTVTVVAATGLQLTDDTTIAAGAAIVGDGTISGAFDLVNLGLIDTTFVPPLTINTGTFANSGTVEAVDGGVTIESGVDTTNLSNGTLTGGTWIAEAGETIYFETGIITNVNASVTIGVAEIMGSVPAVSTLQSIESTLTSVAAGGVVSAVDDEWTSTQSLLIAGSMTVLSLSEAAISIAAQGKLTASDEVISGQPLNNDGTLVAVFDLILQPNVTGSGSILVGSGSLLGLYGAGQIIAQEIVNNGSVDLLNQMLSGGVPLSPGGTVTLGKVSGTGTLLATGGSAAATANTVILTGSANGTVEFNLANAPSSLALATLIVEQPTAFADVIGNFDNTSTLVLDNMVGNRAIWNSNTLTILENSVTIDTLTVTPMAVFSEVGTNKSNEHTVESFANYGNASFTAVNSLGNTTITATGITDTVSCFRRGTMLATPDGAARVEDLAPGDQLLTHAGEARLITWAGHRAIDCARHPDPSRVLPIRVARNAFGPGQPCRALYLSPDHAVYVDGVLIPIRHLINDTTIRRVEAETITYYHVALESHDVVMAEGLAVESFLDTGNRDAFSNGGPVRALYPDFSSRTWETEGCAPIVLTGPRLASVRAMLSPRESRSTLMSRAAR